MSDDADRDPESDRGADPALNLEDRALCPDGSCIGVLGDDGRCKLCGRVGAEVYGEAPSAAPLSDEHDGPGEAPTAGTEIPAASDMSLDEDLTDRELCPDGSCVGVIGSDGRCKVCGLAAAL